MITRIKSLSVPYTDAIAGSFRLTPSWERFFQTLHELASPMGFEMTFDLLNNQSSPVALDNLQFDFKKTTFVSMEYVVKRIRAAGPSSESMVETGVLHAYYDPGTEEWGIRKIQPGPDDAGVTFSITTGGVLQSATTNLSGNHTLFKLSIRTMSMKSLISGSYKLIV